jgi:hypothetical protein
MATDHGETGTSNEKLILLVTARLSKSGFFLVSNKSSQQMGSNDQKISGSPAVSPNWVCKKSMSQP